MVIKHHIFISYANEDRKIAEKLSKDINDKIGDDYYTELVENVREGDTTFTEKIIKYFSKCNVFLVILTSNSLHHQFVNQEWGYAKCLKEIGQIQIIKHITEKYEEIDEIPNTMDIYDTEGRIKSRGFIASNMEFIDLKIKEGNHDIDDVSKEVISFLEDKRTKLRPIYNEIRQKLERYRKENQSNIELLNELIENRESLVNKLSMNPKQFSYDVALQLIDIGHFLKIEFVEKVQEYIDKIKILNEWKSLQRDWAVYRRKLHKGNVDVFFKHLSEAKPLFQDIETKIDDEISDN